MDPSWPRNQWGVYDEFLFEHLFKRLSENSEKPKFIFVMTTSNHPPYSLPGSYKPLSLNVSPAMQKDIIGDQQLAKMRFATYQYSNDAAGKFLDRLKKSPLGHNRGPQLLGSI
jgi:phosphoglycerol transferase MdoB-like AlkP superfamily enzyme